MTQTVFPYVLYEDLDAAVDFLTRAFGFRETLRNDRGSHVELEVAPGGGQVYAGRGSGSACTFIRVDDVDAHYERARAAGATIAQPVEDKHYGRDYGATDPAGNQWWFASGA